jgi:ubiquinone/menaquinone biosynthesis C-methylase UbiE
MAHIDHAEANRQHFNETAHSYDAIPLVTEITAKSANAMRAMFDFDEESTVAMDFACGTGKCIAAYFMSALRYLPRSNRPRLAKFGDIL